MRAGSKVLHVNGNLVGPDLLQGLPRPDDVDLAVPANHHFSSLWEGVVVLGRHPSAVGARALGSGTRPLRRNPIFANLSEKIDTFVSVF